MVSRLKEKITKKNIIFFILYVVIAVGTTAVDTLTFEFTYRIIGVLGATTLAWVLAVLFSYIVNCKVLFQSSWGWSTLWKYYTSRFATYLLSMLLMYIMPDGINPTIYKLLSSILIVIINLMTTIAILGVKKAKKS